MIFEFFVKMKNAYLLFVFFIIFISCSQHQKFPEILTEPVSSDNLKINGDVFQNKTQIDSLINNEIPQCIIRLLDFYQMFHEKRDDFNLEDMQQQWALCSNEISVENLNLPALKKWVKVSGLLLQLTNDAKYAEELEHASFASTVQPDEELRNMIAGYIFTKNVDHIHVNLFVPAEINYEHTLHGHVKIVQETDYPDNSRVLLKFSMEKNRYIELFVRIPSWAEGAHVTVEGVKYVAPPGDYSVIAKKWKEGDEVEVFFPGVKNQHLR